MKANFDHIAKIYDQDFTQSNIGKAQRNSVYRYLKPITNKYILELNCGTGQDAIWLTKKKNTVLATDISSKMIKVAQQKANGIKNLNFKQLDINIIVTLKEANFNLVFSNFGGLNCLTPQELVLFFKNVKSIISNGKLILVIMPKNCLWENLYFILKRDFKKTFRRNTTKSLLVNVENSNVKTWYYNPKDIKKIIKPHFKIIKTKPIGFFIPPSYLEPFFAKHKLLFSVLTFLEKTIGKFGFLSRFSDHYLIEIAPKN